MIKLVPFVTRERYVFCLGYLRHSLRLRRAVDDRNNRFNDSGVNRDGGTLDYCRMNSVQIQCYSPYKGAKKSYLGDIRYPKLNKALKELAS